MMQKTKILTLIIFGLLFTNISAQEDSFNNDKVAKLPDEDRKFRFGLQFNPNKAIMGCEIRVMNNTLQTKLLCTSLS